MQHNISKYFISKLHISNIINIEDGHFFFYQAYIHMFNKLLFYFIFHFIETHINPHPINIHYNDSHTHNNYSCSLLNIHLIYILDVVYVQIVSDYLKELNLRTHVVSSNRMQNQLINLPAHYYYYYYYIIMWHIIANTLTWW